MAIEHYTLRLSRLDALGATELLEANKHARQHGCDKLLLRWTFDSEREARLLMDLLEPDDSATAGVVLRGLASAMRRRGAEMSRDSGGRWVWVGNQPQWMDRVEITLGPPRDDKGEPTGPPDTDGG